MKATAIDESTGLKRGADVCVPGNALPRAAAMPSVEAPVVSAFLLKGFLRYLPRMFRKNFNAVRLASGSAPKLGSNRAVICYLNHPGWWDPLVAFLLNQRFFDGRTLYAPIDAAALTQYPVFRKLGFYGVELDSREGARNFLTVTRRILELSNVAIWMTPEGRFTDPRDHPDLEPGLSHVVASSQDISVVPLAVEYTFWQERTPELLLQFGPVMDISMNGDSPHDMSVPRDNYARSKSEWHSRLADSLAETQASLAQKAISRDYTAFESLIDGSAGAGGLYDSVRRIRSWCGLGPFSARHQRMPQSDMGRSTKGSTNSEPS